MLRIFLKQIATNIKLKLNFSCKLNVMWMKEMGNIVVQQVDLSVLNSNAFSHYEVQ